MRKILATIIKEWALLRRDVAGFLLLFLMPALLIIIMALVQDAPFKDYQDIKFDLLLVDEDGGSLAKQIKTGLAGSKNFEVIDEVDGKPVTSASLKSALGSGRYQVGIVIPQGATAEAVNAANMMANTIAEKMGAGRLPVRDLRDSVHVRIYFDPAAKPAFRTSITFALDKFITYSCSNLLLQRLEKLSKSETSAAIDTAQSDKFRKVFQGIGMKEEVLNDWNLNKTYLNSVQHNVPAWAIFGMFFIVIPIAGNMIKEREEGSATRIAIIPHAYAFVAFGKICFYTAICMVQFAIMLGIGIFALPLMGLPSLYLGAYPLLLIPVVMLIAYTATAFGYLAGSVFTTSNQAMPFSAISIVIMSALGGIWVPVQLLPDALQKAAKISPLHWGLDAVQQLTLRNGGLSSIWSQLLVLFGFGSVLWLISIYIMRKRGRSV